MSIYIPFTYLIGWSSLNIYYYGRKTAKNCRPDDLWKTYFTSSKEVKKFRKEHGEPDIIQIRKTFPNNPDACKLWESKVLERIDAQNNPKFLNKRNGDYKWDTTGMVLLNDIDGNKFYVSVDDPRFISGELRHSSKGKVIVRGKNGRCFWVDVDDPRYISGELLHASKGIKQSKETIENRVKHVRGIPKTPEHNKKNSEANKGMCCAKILSSGEVIKTSKLDIRWKSGEIVGVNKNHANGRILSTGEIVYVSVDDPRWKSGDIVGIFKKMTYAKLVSSGEIIKVSPQDIRWKIGELVGVGREEVPIKLTCPHCNKMFDHGNYKQHHGDNCKLNPNYVPKSKKELPKFTCENCGKIVSGKSNLIQHLKGSKCKN